MSDVNVNLDPCDCWGLKPVPRSTVPEAHHTPSCASTPILIPCPVPPSVTFRVVLGACSCGTRIIRSVGGCAAKMHADGCPARPVSVSCSISGETWPESELRGYSSASMDAVAIPGVWDACLARWALVKALVGDGCCGWVRVIVERAGAPPATARSPRGIGRRWSAV